MIPRMGITNTNQKTNRQTQRQIRKHIDKLESTTTLTSDGKGGSRSQKIGLRASNVKVSFMWPHKGGHDPTRELRILLYIALMLQSGG